MRKLWPSAWIPVICLALVVFSHVAQASSHRITAFNVQIFGRAKMAKPLPAQILPEIMTRSQLTFLQEIRDKSDKAINQLMDTIHETHPNYDLLLSPALGRTRSKEKYAYIYDSSLLRPVTSFVLEDPDDVFEREPYVALWEDTTGAHLVTIGIHVKPSAVPEELAHLASYAERLSKLGLSHILILGDLNADCRYLEPDEPFILPNLSYFTSLIDNSIDTTTTATDCTYDRFLASPDLTDDVSDGDIFDHQSYFGLSLEESRLISDHYAIELFWHSQSASDSKDWRRRVFSNMPQFGIPSP
ncbi:MAG: hypothetical protein HRU19_24445 [Pseudobacteriovorax sp.]|nr:hypothetical protein [Pseudobacteriovorax sp.]